MAMIPYTYVSNDFKKYTLTRPDTIDLLLIWVSLCWHHDKMEARRNDLLKLALIKSGIIYWLIMMLM